jgi:phosphoserine phosphatase
MNGSREEDYIEVIRDDCQRGKFEDAVFDFDGTISVLRRGWENVMGPLMVEMICGDRGPLPEIQKEVTEYVDRSTGIMTILQMNWLAEAVGRHGYVSNPLTAAEYKELYIARLNDYISERLASVEEGRVEPDEMMMVGSVKFLELLAQRGCRLHLASGTDQIYVEHEADILGVRDIFGENVKGAVGISEKCAKEVVVTAIVEGDR